MKQKSDLIMRIRQILAADRSAVDVYSDLVHTVDDAELRKKLAKVLHDEKRHVELGQELLHILGE